MRCRHNHFYNYNVAVPGFGYVSYFAEIIEKNLKWRDQKYYIPRVNEVTEEMKIMDSPELVQGKDHDFGEVTRLTLGASV